MLKPKPTIVHCNSAINDLNLRLRPSVSDRGAALLASVTRDTSAMKAPRAALPLTCKNDRIHRASLPKGGLCWKLPFLF